MQLQDVNTLPLGDGILAAPEFLYKPVKCPKAFEDVIRNSIKKMENYHLPGEGGDDD